MRLAIVIVALVCVASATQARDVRESRFGPRSDRQQATAGSTAAYSGPMLGWAGKAQEAAPLPVAPPAAIAQPAAPVPEPSAPWRKLGALPAQPAAQPAVAAPLPESLYTPARATTPARPAAPLPQTQAALSTPPSADALGPSLSRTYSVGRQYGLQPDALPPLKPNGMVFIAPSDPQPATRAEPPRHGSAEWLAGGPAGDETGRDAGKDLSLR
jgi:hypothetical protein